jgi:hypothetical protein
MSFARSSRLSVGRDVSSEGTTVAYSNFELGMTSTTLRLIHLPISYSVRSARYVEDEDEAILCETPYFHEIPPGTGCVGNMLLTPSGTALAAKCEKRA